VTVDQDELTATFTISTSASGTAHIGASSSASGPPQQQATLQVSNLGT
jgi:hypothetical protein